MSDAHMSVEETNYVTFKECLSSIVIKQLTTPSTKPSRKTKRENRAGLRDDRDLQAKNSARISRTVGEDAVSAEELADFVDYLAGDIFPCLPLDLQNLSHITVRNDAGLAAKYETPVPLSTLETLAALVPPSALDSMISYGLLASSPVSIDFTNSAEVVSALVPFVKPLITAYAPAVTTPPPSAQPLVSRSTQHSCEICERDWMPLTYHHLIPRSVHAKVVKRGWHEEWQLNSVAWLCRACHSFVHSLASNEELAREWWSVELLMERDDVQKWANWVGRIRWRAK